MNISSSMEIQVLSSTATASAPWKAKIFFHMSFPERFSEITRAIFFDSLHIMATMAQRSAETPWEGLMIGQLCNCWRCSLSLRRSSQEISVIDVVVPERRRAEAVGHGDSHGHPGRRYDASVVSHPHAVCHASNGVNPSSGEIRDRRESSDAFIERSESLPRVLCIHFVYWPHDDTWKNESRAGRSRMKTIAGRE